MLMYGVYVSRIKNVNWGNVVGMLKKYDHDRYSDFFG